MFFKVFGHRSSGHFSHDRPLVSLLSIGLLAAAWCWFSLDTVIDASTCPTSSCPTLDPQAWTRSHCHSNACLIVHFVCAVTSMLVLVQFIGQGVGLCVLRYRISTGAVPDDPEAWKVRFLPLVASVQVCIFIFIYATTDNWVFSGNDPILDISILFLLGGGAIFFMWQGYKREWPFRNVTKASSKTSTVAITAATASSSPSDEQHA